MENDNYTGRHNRLFTKFNDVQPMHVYGAIKLIKSNT